MYEAWAICVLYFIYRHIFGTLEDANAQINIYFLCSMHNYAAGITTAVIFAIGFTISSRCYCCWAGREERRKSLPLDTQMTDSSTRCSHNSIKIGTQNIT